MQAVAETSEKSIRMKKRMLFSVVSGMPAEIRFVSALRHGSGYKTAAQKRG